MSRRSPGVAAPGVKKPLNVVLLPCITCALLIIFMGVENLLWHTTGYYPVALSRARYVSDASLLTPAAVREICRTPLTQPELRRKNDVLYLRCGTPGLEGVWRIEKYD
ncbi:hypothetical protein ROB49_004349 [Enterobacter cloacae]|uniref:hypothetical protein n=1 Tax=Klebsiella pneumoniae TaxID=573 RepID=UPI0010827B9F|nr:hypothetical protein [Klebsiella pneumoniae]ELG6444308.1 hypothetical protein [Enterobacter cloacae]VFZ29111.1 Uncharacterised protein [Klebsiella pneumoniae]